MASLNTVAFTARLCADPEVRQAGAASVASLRVAIDDSYKSKSGEKVDKAVFIDVDVWGAGADNIRSCLSKGSHVAISGKLVEDTWDDKETGKKRSKIKVRANDFGGVVFLDKRADKPAAGEADWKDGKTDAFAPAKPAAGDEEIPF